MRKSFLLLIPILALPLIGARRRAVMHPAPPTFSNEVSRIFQQHCQSCHHPNDIAPFSLMTYREAAGRAFEIKAATQARIMPPWRAANGCGDFVGARRMTQQQIDTIAAWADAGAPEGNRADLPPERVFDGGWPLGAPDLVLSMSKPFTPPATQDEYRCFSIPVKSANDLFVSAIDFRPGDRGTVHHIVPFLDTTGESARLDRDGNGLQCFGGAMLPNADIIGAWSPGGRPTPLPSGTAVRIPRNARVVMQVHYHPHMGKVAPDRTEIGLYLTKEEVRKRLEYDVVFNENLVIPAGATDHRVDASMHLDAPIELVSIYPHMHLLGRKIRVEAILPGGEQRCLIVIDDYDFNWQGAYVFREPLTLPAGSQIHIEAHYDNSADNLRNPNTPPREVRWGEASTDEMCVALIGYTRVSS